MNKYKVCTSGDIKTCPYILGLIQNIPSPYRLKNKSKK